MRKERFLHLDIWEGIGFPGERLRGFEQEFIISDGVYVYYLNDNFLCQAYDGNNYIDWFRYKKPKDGFLPDNQTLPCGFNFVFENVNQDIKIKLLYHLDLFNK